MGRPCGVEVDTAGRGVAFNDPKGYAVIDIISLIPEQVAGKVVLFDPEDRPCAGFWHSTDAAGRELRRGGRRPGRRRRRGPRAAESRAPATPAASRTGRPTPGARPRTPPPPPAPPPPGRA